MSLQVKLRTLFQLDQQVRGMRSRLEAATRRHKAQQTKLDQLNRQRAELAEQLKQTQAKATALEKQSLEVEAKITRLREQMNTVKNNKEYSALLVEVSTLKNDKGKAEEEALTEMAKVDALKKDMLAIEAKVADQQKLVAGAVAEVKDCESEVGQKLTDAAAQRDAAASEIPAETRSLFEKAAKVHEGEGMAPVVEENRRAMEYHCGGCFMGIPAERVNALMTKDDQIVSCPNCGRLLYVEEELRASMRK